MPEARPRLAIIGAGISGLSAAWLLRDAYEVTLFEAEPRAGGHADTQTVNLDGEEVAVDTGFIVFNNVNYPNLVGFFAALGVASHESNMSFGVSKNNAGYEYAGGELKQLFAQPANMFKRRFWRMVADILRFNRQAPKLLDDAATQESLGEYLIANHYSEGFVEDYILPMGAAIWSASVEGMKAFPAKSFVRFFVNHGLLRINDRPQWRTVTGGSRIYVQRVLRDLGNIRLGTPVQKIRRTADGGMVETAQGSAIFAEIIFACHADQALAMIEQPSAREAEVLGAIKFQDNIAVLHQDAALMPRRKLAWSSWNYLSQGRADQGQAICLTYWMNLLQGLKTRHPLLVSLNPSIGIDPAKILRRMVYRHPQFNAAAIQAQESLGEIQGVENFWFAGAWTGWGFHEDGIASAVRVANALGVRAPWQTS
jgi:predicted NAD/FAD-binding protein